jgi:hypothetical protein
MTKKTVFRISFLNEDTIYQIYARKVYDSELFGFIEAEEFVFGTNTSLVVDPSEERLQMEFADIKRTFIPMQSIIRIDEVHKEGVAKITEAKAVPGNVSLFPRSTYKRDDK